MRGTGNTRRVAWRTCTVARKSGNEVSLGVTGTYGRYEVSASRRGARGAGGSGSGEWGHDLVAGASVALVLIPQAMAYARLAGLPPHHGLYAAALPPVAAAFFASSPYLQTGPTAITSLLTLGALARFAPASTSEYVGAAALLALVVGVVRVVVGLLRAGAMAYLMSEPVLRGFVSAAALLIILSQLPGALGVDGEAGGVIAAALRAAVHPGAWEAASVVLAVVTVMVTLGARRVHPLVPGVLVAALIGLGFSVSTGYGGPTVGEIPAGLPRLSVGLPWHALPELLVPGAVIALVGFAEPASIARMYAAADRTPWDPNREFTSQGLANLVAGIFSGFPVGGSFGRSGVIRLAGGRTRRAGAVAGLIVLAFLPFADVLAALPLAVLSAIVIAAVTLDLARAGMLLGFWRLSRLQGVVAWATFALTLALAPHVEQAILVGIVLALAVHLWRELRLPLESWTEGDTMHVRPRGVLWFATAPGVEEELVRLFSCAGSVRRVVIHLGGLGRVDLTGALVLREVLRHARAAGLEAELADVPPHAYRVVGSVLGWRSPQGGAGSPADPADPAARADAAGQRAESGDTEAGGMAPPPGPGEGEAPPQRTAPGSEPGRAGEARGDG